MHPCVSLQMKFKCVQKSEPKSEWAQLDLVAIPRPPARCLSVSPVCPLVDSFSKSNQSCQFAVAIYFFCNVLRLYQILFGGALKSHTHTQKDEGKDL